MTVKHLLEAIYWIWLASEILLVIITRTRRSTGETHDRGSLLLLWPTIFFSIWGCLYYGATHPHTMFGGPHWLLIVARCVFLAGLAIRWSAIYTLGRSFSVNVAIHATQTVKKTGLFRLVRHPSYTGLMMIFLALGLNTRNWIALAIMMVPSSIALLYRIHVEEAALTEAFGPAYSDYSRSTHRLIPGIY